MLPKSNRDTEGLKVKLQNQFQAEQETKDAAESKVGQPKQKKSK